MEEKRFTAVSGRAEPGLAAAPLVTASPAGAASLAIEEFAHKLWRNRWLLLSYAAVGTLVALMLGALQPALYKAQTSIEIQAPDHNSQRPESDAADGVPPSESYLQTQIRIIESRSLVERVLSKLSDVERARLLENRRFWWNRISYDQTLESIRQHVSARPSEQAGIVDITFSSPDAAAGAHFLNLLTQELSDFNIERSWRSAQHSRQWAERQIDELRRKWEQSEQLLAEYSQSPGLSVAVKHDLQRPPSSAKPLPKSQTSREQAADLASREANDSNLRQLRSKLSNLNSQISQWQALYGASGAQMQNLKAEASATEAAIRQRRASFHQSSGPAPSSYAVIDSSIPQDGGLQDRLPPNHLPSSQAQAMAHLNALKQEADSNHQIFESAAARLKEASVAGVSLPGDISVVDRAVPVSKSTNPGQFLVGLLGSLVGLAFGGAFVALRDQLSRTFSEPAVLSSYLGLPVIGAIPADRFALNGNTYDPITQEPALHLDFAIDPETAEAYRSIRSSILLRTGKKSGPRRLVVTSAGASEGKTSVVGNLGAALASAQRRVLLVDGNLRNPGLHKIFGADNEHGLAELLSRPVPDHPIEPRDVIRETQIPDLYLLSAGQADGRAPEILSSARLPDLIREFARGFDLVLLDSPPIIPYSDARSLARAADAVILVVKAGTTDRQAAIHARDAIGQDESPIMGAILTEWDSVQAASS